MLPQFKNKLLPCLLCGEPVKVYMDCGRYKISCWCGITFYMNSIVLPSKGETQEERDNYFIKRWNTRKIMKNKTLQKFDEIIKITMYNTHEFIKKYSKVIHPTFFSVSKTNDDDYGLRIEEIKNYNPDNIIIFDYDMMEDHNHYVFSNVYELFTKDLLLEWEKYFKKTNKEKFYTLWKSYYHETHTDISHDIDSGLEYIGILDTENIYII